MIFFRASLILPKIKCEEVPIFRRLGESTPKAADADGQKRVWGGPRGLRHYPTPGVQSPRHLYLFFNFWLLLSGRLILSGNV